MGDVDEGGADAPLDGLELVLHLAPELQVEGAERLVEQQHGGLDHERPGQRDALPLAAGELVRPLLEGPSRPTSASASRARSRRARAATPRIAQAEADIGRRRDICGNSA